MFRKTSNVACFRYCSFLVNISPVDVLRWNRYFSQSVGTTDYCLCRQKFGFHKFLDPKDLACQKKSLALLLKKTSKLLEAHENPLSANSPKQCPKTTASARRSVLVTNRNRATTANWHSPILHNLSCRQEEWTLLITAECALLIVWDNISRYR